LVRPGRDPREDLPAPVFKRGIIKLEDLSASMELTGTVLNVVDFGCFVDIGMHDSGLVHVSRLADKFIRDPHDVVAVGDIVRVWVMEIDKDRRRVSLTMVKPGSERPKHPQHPQHGGRPEHQRPAGEGAPPPHREGQGRQQQRPPQRTGGGGGGRDAHTRGPHTQGRPQQRPPYHPPARPRPAPKPLIQITDGMKAGKEPMRTFGDLLQFYHQKPGDAEASPPAAAAPKTPAPMHEPPAVRQEAPAAVSDAPAMTQEPPVPVNDSSATPDGSSD
jgi:protein Tex